MERDGLQRFMAATSHRVLTREEERLLAVRKDGGDQAAFDELVLHNVRLVYSLARRHHRSTVPLDDLIQYGLLGLIRAVEKFDISRGFKLSTYATWWIRQALDRAVFQHERTVRLPQHVAAEIAAVARAQRKLQADLGRDATDDEIADQAKLTVERVRELQRIRQPVLSTDGFLNEDGEQVEPRLAATADEVDVEDDLLARSRVVELRAAIARLPERDQLILRLRFGLDGEREHSLAEVGDQLGVTRERVRQLQNQALRTLRGWVQAA